MTEEPSGLPDMTGGDEPPTAPEPTRRRGRHAFNGPSEPPRAPVTLGSGEPTEPPPTPLPPPTFDEAIAPAPLPTLGEPTEPPPPAPPTFSGTIAPPPLPTVAPPPPPERAPDLPGGLRFGDPAEMSEPNPDRRGVGFGFSAPSTFPEPPPEGFSRRSIALLAGGGLAIVAIAILLVAALSSGDLAPRRPAAAPETQAPVIPVSTDSPTTAAPSVTRSSASPRPTASKTSARPSGSPSPTGGGRVLSVTVTADPAEFTTCRGTLSTRLTVRMTLSQPGLSVRYTINETMTMRATATGTSFSETTKVTVSPRVGEHQVRIAVSAPSAASAQTIVDVDCGR